ncbi:PREDICTED: uncharacterized protein LOC109585874 isoform X1 [Amphimedon queenslandica]|uniref:Uncharacterized protein n=1 Tax=Amphimedon queenslandica TaxID=400682 RepID=A0AAN0JLE4_AMPQE|nr:PREDICTED: uncharacterized protein LOC109585874 isoform X1 [Amphimedon queenslandica]|eukprot:XP_019857581.1 PREDICTED: uncharacterized protein LOC109585874 isoform X1 [Amphimedon queenslandica]
MMWRKLGDLNCLEAILQFECFGNKQNYENELKNCKLTNDNQIFIEWNNPVSSYLLKLPPDILNRIAYLIKEEVFIRVGNFSVRPSGPHPVGFLDILCGYSDLLHLQECLKPVTIPVELKCKTADTNEKFRYFIDAMQYFSLEKAVINTSEVTLYSKVVPILWMVTKDMPVINMTGS